MQRHKNKAEEKAISIALVVMAYLCLAFLRALYFALNLLTARGSPLQQIVTRLAKTEKAIWYTPRASAPITRDIYILKIKPERRVKIVKIVIKATVLSKFFIV